MNVYNFLFVMENKMNHAGPVPIDCTSMTTAGCSSAPNSSAYAIDNTQLGKKKLLWVYETMI